MRTLGRVPSARSLVVGWSKSYCYSLWSDIDRLSKALKKKKKKKKKKKEKTKTGSLFADSFQEKTEEEWKEMEKHLKPVIQEVEEDSENRQSPENLIGDDETIDG